MFSRGDMSFAIHLPCAALNIEFEMKWANLSNLVENTIAYCELIKFKIFINFISFAVN